MNIILSTFFNRLKKGINGNIISLLKHLGDNVIRILILQENNSLSGLSINGIKADVFTDSNGFLNTVNTTDTTASFTTNYYSNGNLVLNINNTLDSDYVLIILSDINDDIEAYKIDSNSVSKRIDFNKINPTNKDFSKLKIVIPSSNKVYGYCVISW